VAKFRVQLAENEQPIADYLRPFKLKREELYAHELKHRSQMIESKTKLKEAKGQIQYLLTLLPPDESDDVTTESLPPQTQLEDDEHSCPVCYDRLGEQVVYLCCAHRLCPPCAEVRRF